MITDLRISNLGVIESAEIEFNGGLTAITGETGAGKTMIVTALGLISGARGDSSMVRVGTESAVIEARFQIEEDEVVIRRVLSSSGRSKAFINGDMSTLKEIAAKSAELFEIHGQNGAVQLFQPTFQRDLLDSFGKVDTAKMHELQSELRHLRKEVESLAGDPTAREREIDLLQYQLDEIGKAAILSANEDDDLKEREEFLANASSLVATKERFSTFVSADNGAADTLAEVQSALAVSSELADIRNRIASVLTDLQDIESEFEKSLGDLENPVAELDQLQARRAVLTELRRKYGASLQDVIEFADSAQQRLALITSHDDRLVELQHSIEVLDAELQSEMKKVGNARRKAAEPFAKAVKQAVAGLAMSSADFAVKLSDDFAADSVEFQFNANPGNPLGPLAKIASGGELSRTMLAIYLASGSMQSLSTNIFDEVDAGVGGQAAVSVGRALASVATTAQVLVVTHLPQVAAFADQQINIEKSSEGALTTSSMRELGKEDRLVELTRMMSGQAESASGRKHAEELLDLAAAERKKVPVETK